MQIQPSGAPATEVQQPHGAANRTPQKIGAEAPAIQNPQTNKSQKTEEKDTVKSVQDATKRLQEFVSNANGNIQFSVDEGSGETVVKVIDRVSQEVLRQIPSKEALEIARALDRFQGLLVKQQA